MKIVEAYAKKWALVHKATDQELKLLVEFAREIERLMGIKEEAHEQKN